MEGKSFEKWEGYLTATCFFKSEKQQFTITGWIGYLMPEVGIRELLRVCVFMHELKGLRQKRNDIAFVRNVQ